MKAKRKEERRKCCNVFPSCQKTLSHFLVVVNNYKISIKVFSYAKLKLRAPEIPKHSFHGSYDLNPVDVENRGRRTEIMLFFLSGGCRAVCDQKFLPAFKSVYNGM